DVIIGQLVNLLRDGEPVRLSKRKGTMVTFEELLDEVGSDATRYLMISRSTDQSIDFDIEVAKKQDSSNPVFYVQYAHARICSILRRATGIADEYAADCNLDAPVQALIALETDLSPLVEESEFALMRKISEFPEVLEGAARDYAPFRLTHYAESLASTFHQFYTKCHVLTDDEDLTKARLAAVDASRIVLRLVLSLLGVSAPVKM
ncbi:MAG: arginine--tRNA ligase, partial [Actinobacteria bacterium]|nr:arginine--tRNA ligase [Actinomycetota bacterium]